jgi:hypothetical protein
MKGMTTSEPNAPIRLRRRRRVGVPRRPTSTTPVQPVGAGLVTADRRQACVDRRVGPEQPVTVGGNATARASSSPPRSPPARAHQTSVVELDVGTRDPGQRVQTRAHSPGEPFPQLEGVQGVGPAGVARQDRDPRELGGGHPGPLERQQGRRSGHRVTSRGDLAMARPCPPPTRPGTRTAATLAVIRTACPSARLNRPGARYRRCCRPVSPGRSPNPACASQRTGLSTTLPCGLGLAQPYTVKSVLHLRYPPVVPTRDAAARGRGARLVRGVGDGLRLKRRVGSGPGPYAG